MALKKENFTPGMPIRLQDLIMQSRGMQFSELVKNTIENTNVCIIHDGTGRMMHILPILGDNISTLVDSNLIRAKGWSAEVQKYKDQKFTALTGSFWTCGCEKKYVKHRIVMDCPVCNETVLDRLGYVEDLFPHGILQWEFIVGE